MKKDFVPNRFAFALKQLGFDEPCLACWNYHTHELNYNRQPSTFYSEDVVQLPTFAQAFRWFRDKHNIDSWVQPFVMQSEIGKIYLPDETYSYYIFKDGEFIRDEINFDEPEDAEISCLENLIELLNIIQTRNHG